jgi:hypothetical protein
VITDAQAFARLCEDERWEVLARMSVEESIALGEALLTSELMKIALFDRTSRPVCLAVSLGMVAPLP